MPAAVRVFALLSLVLLTALGTATATCSPDFDGDGICEGDNCPFVSNPSQSDVDGDLRGGEPELSRLL